MSRTMRAAVLRAAGPPSNLKIESRPIPTPQNGQVLLQVKAIGLNRSELLTRKFGQAPIGPVQLPRVLGLECAGIIESAPNNESKFPKGSIAVAALGGMGIVIDGTYAEYVVAPSTNVHVLDPKTSLPWEVLGALPEMLQTAHGCLHRSLRLKAGDTLLIRGATTSVGLAATAIAKKDGARVLATTRRSDSATEQMLKENGAEHVLVDDGSLATAVKQLVPSGVDKVLELVGATTLVDSLACLARGGICCFTGLVGGSPILPQFNPLAMVQTETFLTAYAERNFNANNFPIDELVADVAQGKLKIKIGKTFSLDEIVSAHECMEGNNAQGKIVVLV